MAFYDMDYVYLSENGTKSTQPESGDVGDYLIKFYDNQNAKQVQQPLNLPPPKPKSKDFEDLCESDIEDEEINIHAAQRFLCEESEMANHSYTHQNHQVEEPVSESVKKGPESQPLMTLSVNRSLLYINTRTNIESSYIRVQKGKAKQTKHMHQHIKTLNKTYFKQEISNKSIESTQIEIIQKYLSTSPSFASMQTLLGVRRLDQDSITVDDSSDSIRLKLESFYGSSNYFKKVLSGELSFIQKLRMVKFSESIRQAPVSPQTFTKWKKDN